MISLETFIGDVQGTLELTETTIFPLLGVVFEGEFLVGCNCAYDTAGKYHMDNDRTKTTQTHTDRDFCKYMD